MAHVRPAEAVGIDSLQEQLVSFIGIFSNREGACQQWQLLGINSAILSA